MNEEPRKVIGIDMDDVLIRFLDGFLSFHNTKYDSNFNPNDFDTFDFWKTLGCTHDESVRRVHDFFESEEFANLDPVPGAVDAVNSLAELYDLYIITARPDSLSDKTHSWIERHFAGCFKGIFFTNGFEAEEKRRKKSEFCAKVGAEVMIDDSANHARDCSAACSKVLLFNKPWNIRREDMPEAVSRVRNWNDILEEISLVQNKK